MADTDFDQLAFEKESVEKAVGVRAKDEKRKRARISKSSSIASEFPQLSPDLSSACPEMAGTKHASHERHKRRSSHHQQGHKKQASHSDAPQLSPDLPPACLNMAGANLDSHECKDSKRRRHHQHHDHNKAASHHGHKKRSRRDTHKKHPRPRGASVSGPGVDVTTAANKHVDGRKTTAATDDGSQTPRLPLVDDAIAESYVAQQCDSLISARPHPTPPQRLVFPGAYREGGDDDYDVEMDTAPRADSLPAQQAAERDQISESPYVAVANLVQEPVLVDSMPQEPPGWWSKRQNRCVLFGAILAVVVGLVTGIVISQSNRSLVEPGSVAGDDSDVQMTGQPTQFIATTTTHTPTATTIPCDIRDAYTECCTSADCDGSKDCSANACVSGGSPTFRLVWTGNGKIVANPGISSFVLFFSLNHASFHVCR